MQDNKDNNLEFATIHNMMAHKLRTSFLTISSGANAIKDLIVVLVDSYHYAKSRDISLQNISEKSIDLLFTVLSNISKQAQFADFFLNLSIFSMGTVADSNEKEKISFESVLQECLNNFQSYINNSNKIFNFELHMNNFIVNSNMEKLQMIIFSILYHYLSMNSLEKKSIVKISTSSSLEFNIVTFNCSKVAVYQKILEFIFDKYYLYNDQLYFGLFSCNATMNILGGYMECAFDLSSNAIIYKLFFPI